MSKNQTKEKETEEEKKARETVEEIARNIAMLSRQVTALLNGRLNRKAVLILLANTSGYPQTVVNQILTAIEELETKFLKK